MSGTTMDMATAEVDEQASGASAAAAIERTSGVQVRMALTCILLTVFGGAMSAPAAPAYPRDESRSNALEKPPTP